MIPDWQHNANREQRKRLEGEGYVFNISSTGYQVWHKDTYLHGASSASQGSCQKKRRHHMHIKDDLRDYLSYAVNVALRHKQAQEVQDVTSLVVEVI